MSAALRGRSQRWRQKTSGRTRLFDASMWVMLTLLAIAIVMSISTAATGQSAEAPDLRTVERIDFQVRVTYRYAANIVTQVMSNRVNVGVMAARGVSLVSIGDRTVMPGGSASFVYTLTNQGNVVDTFDLTQSFPPGSGITAEWWYDMDNNGRADPGDVKVTDTTGDGKVDTGPIAPKGSRRLVMVAKVPESAPFAVHPFEAKAISLGDPQKSAAVSNKLEVTDSAPYISVEEAPDHVYEGQKFILPIDYGNTGSRPVEALSITAPLSPYVTYVSSSPAGTYDPETHSVTWPLDRIDPETDGRIYVTLFAQDGHPPGSMVKQTARLRHSGSLVLESSVEATLATRFPTFIQIVADPNVIRADGHSTSRLAAVVTDMVGNGVEDNTVITFRTPKGTLRPVIEGSKPCPPDVAQGDACLQVPALGGLARADLISPRIDSNEYTEVPVTVSAWNPDTGEIKERLSMYFSPGAIVGRLINVETGHPEAGVEVRLVRLDGDGNPIGETTVKYTDENGYYVFPVPEGDYKLIVVRKTDAGSDTFDLPVVEVSEAYDSVTFAPITIRGRLLDRATGLGMPFATVDLFDENGVLLGTTVTDEKGDYVFIITDATLSVAAQSVAPQAVLPQGVVPPQGPAGQSAGSGGVAPQSIAVRPIVPQDVSPMAELARPTWRVRARTEDGRGAEAGIKDVRPGDMVVNLNLLVEPLGKVVDKLTGKPVPGASVALVWAGPPVEDQVVILPMQHGALQANPALTDADGVYRFEVSPGYYKLVVMATGYRPLETAPMVVQGDQLALTLAIEPLGSDLIDLGKEALSPYSRPGEQISYVLLVKNLTNHTLNQVTVADALPGDLAYVADTANKGGLYDGLDHTLRWTLENLGPGASVSLHYDVTVGAVPAGSVLTNIARAQVTGDPQFATAMADTHVADWPDVVIEKRSDRDEAAIGDVVRYVVKVGNRSEATMARAVAIEDVLPPGFAYVPGSTTLDDASAPDPVRAGRTLLWALGDMAAETERTLTYAAVVTLGAADSDGLNVAHALGETVDGHPFHMGPAAARVRVQEGLFGYKGRIVGRVFVDDDGDGRPDSGEPGLKGADVALDDGRTATTGEHGFFTIDEIDPGVRSVKLVGVSLPYGVGPEGDGTGESPAQAGTRGGWSHFAQVRPGGVAIVDFPVPAGMGETRDAALMRSAPADAGAMRELALTALRLEDAATEIEREAHPRIVEPEPYAVSYRRLVTVTIEGRLGEPLRLLSNGTPIPDAQVGRRVEDGGEDRLTMTYYGVQLTEGKNVLTAESGDARHDVTVVVVGRPANVQVAALPESVPYRKERWVPVTLAVTDALGLPVEDGTALTVDAAGARIRSRDENATRPGVQMSVHDGLLRVLLAVAGDHRGGVMIAAETSEHRWELPVEAHFLPEPRLLVGAIDFKLPLDGRQPASATGSIYLRQEYEDGWRVGARLDARRNPFGASTASLPAMTLPLDDSRVADLAPSRDQFYLRVDRYDSHLLYGDFAPSGENANRFTARAGKATGFEGALVGESGRLTAYAFASQWTAERDRIPAEGVAGLYYLGHAHILTGTEEIWLVAYDPDDADFLNPSSRTLLKRGKEYDIDYRSGSLLFFEPIPTYNESFDRNYIEATYSVPSQAGDGAAYGVRYDAPETALGRHALSYAGESGPQAGRPVVGLDGELKLGGGGATLGYELAAQGETAESEAGRAAALRLSLQPLSGMRLAVRAQQIEGEFVRPGDKKAQTPGVTLESKADLRIHDRWEVTYERSQSVPASGAPRYTDKLQLPFERSSKVSGSLVLRSSGSEPLPWGAGRRASLGVTGEVATSAYGRLGVRQEYSLDGGEAGRTPTTLTYRHRLSQAISASVQYQGELGSGGQSPWLLSVESTPEKGPRLYGRYRPSGNAEDETQAILGVENRWELARGLYAGVKAERTTDDASKATTAAAWHVEYALGPQLGVRLDHERRFAGENASGAVRLGLGGRTGRGFVYELGASWLQGGKASADGRSVSRELHGQLTYRDPVTGRGYAAGEYRQSLYTISSGAEWSETRIESTVFAAEAGYRVAQRVTLSGKVAIKRTVTDWAGNPADPFDVGLALQQLGLQVQLDERHSLDLYARRLADNFGGEVSGVAWEIVRMLTGDIGISVGYGTIGVDDPDVRLVADWRAGLYAGLRLKF